MASLPDPFLLLETVRTYNKAWFLPVMIYGIHYKLKDIDSGDDGYILMGESSALNMSKTFHSGYAEALTTIIGKTTDAFLLSPRYLTDVQICTTGKTHIGEDYITGASREVAEELGIALDAKDLVKVASYKYKRADHVTYIVDIDKCSPITESSPSSSKSDTKDDMSKRIQVFIYGKKDTIMSKVEEVKYFPSREKDKTYGCSILKASDVLSCSKYIDGTKII